MNVKKLTRTQWILCSVLVSVVSTGGSLWWVFQAARPRATPVAVAASTLLPGSRVGTPVVSMVDWPRALLPTGFQVDATRLEGRYVRTTIPKGTPILEGALAPEGSHGGLSAIIASGHRAITVRVNEVVGVAGFALPGNFVDVLVNSGREGAPGQEGLHPLSRIVLEHVPVLAIAQEANPDETKPHVVNAVTLEVTPEEAERLDLARNIGSLSLVLRNQVDARRVITQGATRSTLFRGESLALAPRRIPGAEIIRGLQRSPGP